MSANFNLSVWYTIIFIQESWTRESQMHELDACILCIKYSITTLASKMPTGIWFHPICRLCIYIPGNVRIWQLQVKGFSNINYQLYRFLLYISTMDFHCLFFHLGHLYPFAQDIWEWRICVPNTIDFLWQNTKDSIKNHTTQMYNQKHALFVTIWKKLFRNNVSG